MKKIITLMAFVMLSILSGSVVQAASHANQPGHLGIGGIIGEPTGLSAKYTIDSGNAIQGAVGFSVIERGVWINADYLIQFPEVFTSDGNWPLYVGAGVILQDRGVYARNNNTTDGIYFGVRVVTGVEFLVRDRVSIFGEVSLSTFLAPNIGLGLGLGIGGRYWL